MTLHNEIEKKLNSLPLTDDSLSFRIVEFFKKDVSNYLEILKDTEKKILLDKSNTSKIQDVLNDATYRIVSKGYEMERFIQQKSIMFEVKKIFRSLIIPWMGQSIIMKRALEKPRGYPGDYILLEYIYDNKPISEGIGFYFDRGFLENELTVAVRNRKDMMSKLLMDSLRKNTGTKVNILNLASGPCREIREIQENFSKSGSSITCVDYDKEALDYARSKIGNNVNITFLQEDIIDLIKRGLDDLFKDKDLIYSIGLIDYLPDRVLKKFIQICFDGLRPKGKLILSHKDHNRYIPMREDWLTDWTFIPRDEVKLKNMLAEVNIPKSNIEIAREKSQIIFFLIINKN